MFRRIVVCSAVSLSVFAALLQAQPAAPALTVVHTLQGHTELVYGVSFTPDGRYLVSGAFDKSVKVWDVSSGKEVKSFAGPTGHQDIILGAAMSPDGKLFASCGKDNTIKLWDFPGNALVREFTGSPQPLGMCAVTPDGAKLATACADGTIRLWNSADGKPLNTITVSDKPITGLAISANGQTLAAGSADGSVRLWSLADGKLQGTLSAHRGSLAAMAFHPNNQALITIGSDSLMKSWPLPLPAKTVAELPGKPTVTVLGRFMDGSRWLAACADRTVRILKSDTVTQEKALPAAPADISALAGSGNVVVAALVDGRVATWDASANVLLHVQAMHPGKKTTGISIRGDGNEVAVAFEDGAVRIAELSKEKDKPAEEVFSKRLPMQAPGLTAVAHHPSDLNLLITTGADKAIKFWRAKEGKAEKTIALEAPAAQVLWNRDGSRVAALSGNIVVVHQVADGKLVCKLPHAAPVSSLHFIGDGLRVATTSDDGQIHLWEVNTGKELTYVTTEKPKVATLSADQKQWIVLGSTAVMTQAMGGEKSYPAPKPPRSLVLVEGGNKLIIGCEDGVSRLINPGNGAVEREFKGHSGAVVAVAVTPNGQLLLTGGADKTVRAFTMADGKEIKSLPVSAAVQHLAVSASGTALAVAAADNSAVVLSIPFAQGQPLPEAFGKELQKLAHAGPVLGLAPAGALLFTSSADKVARAWKLASDGPTRNLTGHAGLVDAVAFSGDGQSLASCSHDGTVRFWNPSDGKQTSEVKLSPQPQPFYCIAWRPDGKQVAVGGFDRGIRTVDVAGKKVDREIKGFDEKSAPHGHKDAVYSVAYTSNGQQLYSAGSDGQIKLWNLADGGQVRTFIDPALKDKAHRDWINQIKLTVDGTRLVAVGNGGWITIWNTADGKLIHSQKLPTGLYGTSISTDGKSIATGNQNGTVYILKMP